MRHHDPADWIDYLRGVAAPARREAMDAHLREGCGPCHDTLEGLRAFARAIAVDEACEPPAGAVRCARALFSQFHVRHLSSLRRTLARVVRDSLREPLPAGVRGYVSSSRQVLYEAGPILIDLRLDQRPGRRAIVLVGQLLRRNEGVPVDRQPVVLTSGSEIVASLASNEHGEFQVEYVPAGQMRLHVPVDEGRARVEIGLNRVTPRAERRTTRRGAGGAGSGS